MNLSALAARYVGVTPRKGYIAVPLLMMAVLYWLSSLPGTPTPDDPALYALLRWVAPSVQNVLHVPAYAGLAWAWHWTLGAWVRAPSARPVVACVIAIAYGFFDEWHQSFVPGRYGSLTDVLLDSIGAALGIWCAVRAHRYGADRTAVVTPQR